MKRTSMFTGMLAGIVLLVMSVLSASTAYAQSAGTAKNVAKQTSVSTAKPANGWLMTKEGISPVKIGMRLADLPKCVNGLYSQIVPITDDLVNLKQGNESLQLKVNGGIIRGITIYSKLVKVKVGSKFFSLNGNFDNLCQQPDVTLSPSHKRAEYKGITAEDYEGCIGAFYIGEVYDLIHTQLKTLKRRQEQPLRTGSDCFCRLFGGLHHLCAYLKVARMDVIFQQDLFLRLQYRSHCAQMSYPSIAPKIKSSSGESRLSGRSARKRMARMHSGRPK